MRASEATVYCDVMIVGGGVAGALVAARLSDLGYSCHIVEKDALGAAQSGHSHGYLHSGYIYLRAEPGLVRELKRSQGAWHRYLTEPERIVPVTDQSLVGFENDLVGRYGSQSWSTAGLETIAASEWDLPKTLAGGPIEHAYVTCEPSYDFTQVLRNVVHRLHNCRFQRGTVTRLELKGATAVKVFYASADTLSPRSVVAKFFVLAAGVGNEAILENTLGRYRVPPTIRTSFMLVIRGRPLEPLSLILPENQFYGLFLVSRCDADCAVWLVSNYLSYGGLCKASGVPARTWTRATMRVFDRVFPALRDSKLEYGLYAAAKAELRRDPERLGGRVFDDFGLKNVIAVWPTKLTLAPVAAAEIVNRIVSRLGHPNEPSESKVRQSERADIPVADESWKAVRLKERGEFLASVVEDG